MQQLRTKIFIVVVPVSDRNDNYVDLKGLENFQPVERRIQNLTEAVFIGVDYIVKGMVIGDRSMINVRENFQIPHIIFDTIKETTNFKDQDRPTKNNNLVV